MNLPAGEVFRCPCCGQVLFSVSADGTEIQVRCHRATTTRVGVFSRLGLIRPGPARRQG
jgi:hypothetical protein